ncbi:methyltransferase [Microbacterium hominis]|uniref:class I SAM-dependent methyltransferase n=1 Tax=Microbacterium TaxID=33882 RepID=UPI00168B138C|nr:MULTISPECIES: methyltransferase [Microbacterium]QOC25035.1 methyltransferase [Microbacterium hominis]QOC29081.1 methyltransferase [Microbacterium hominis]QYF98704.1 methyltransferase [Microbacterium sp. PAMC21962]
MSFPFERLRRAPDIEGKGLVAADAADRLILDESAALRTAAGPGEIVVIGDGYGALALGAAFAGARDVRVHQDALSGERALAANARALGLDDRVSSGALDAALVSGARVVLLRLPRALDALRDIAGLIAAHAVSDVVVVAGGRLKHMTVAMNDVLRSAFDTLDVTHARQKSRVLIARDPRGVGGDPVPAAARIDGLEVRAFGGAFAGARLDIGTRALLAALDAAPAAPAGGTPDDPWIDLACGTGIIGAWLARRHPAAHVYASDPSAVAVASARATAAANGLADRVMVARADGLEQRADASASFIALNPPFHSGAALTAGIAERLFADAGRVLRPGGELWCVWNSPLRYRPALDRLVGPTRQLARDAKFTVTVSTRR